MPEAAARYSQGCLVPHSELSWKARPPAAQTGGIPRELRTRYRFLPAATAVIRGRCYEATFPVHTTVRARTSAALSAWASQDWSAMAVSTTSYTSGSGVQLERIPADRRAMLNTKGHHVHRIQASGGLGLITKETTSTATPGKPHSPANNRADRLEICCVVDMRHAAVCGETSRGPGYRLETRHPRSGADRPTPYPGATGCSGLAVHPGPVSRGRGGLGPGRGGRGRRRSGRPWRPGCSHASRASHRPRPPGR